MHGKMTADAAETAQALTSQASEHAADIGTGVAATFAAAGVDPEVDVAKLVRKLAQVGEALVTRATDAEAKLTHAKQVHVQASKARDTVEAEVRKGVPSRRGSLVGQFGEAQVAAFFKAVPESPGALVTYLGDLATNLPDAAAKWTAVPDGVAVPLADMVASLAGMKTRLAAAIKVVHDAVAAEDAASVARDQARDRLKASRSGLLRAVTGLAEFGGRKDLADRYVVHHAAAPAAPVEAPKT